MDDNNTQQELDGSHTTLNEYKNEIKRLSLENYLLKKIVQDLQTGHRKLKKAEESKAVMKEPKKESHQIKNTNFVLVKQETEMLDFDLEVSDMNGNSQEHNAEDAEAISLKSFDLNNITGMVHASNPSPYNVVISRVSVTGAANTDKLLADTGRISSDKSSSQCTYIEPPDEFADCTPELLNSRSETPASLLISSIVSPDKKYSNDPCVETSIPADLADREFVSYGYLKIMSLLTMLIFFSFFSLFFGLIFIGKALLPENDFITFLYILGIRYHPGVRLG